MHDARPSRTAMRVALRRAAHQIFDTPKVLDDPVALAVVGADTAERLRAPGGEARGRLARSVRAFMAARSRFAEDELGRAVGAGARQYVVLGAGLDTFAYRNPFAADGLRVFEVDHPATQAWKRERLAERGHRRLDRASRSRRWTSSGRRSADGLAAAGFDHGAPAFFSWLGVIMYLTESAIASTLAFVAATPPGGGMAFDYAVPPASLAWRGRLAAAMLSRRVAAAGEPFRTYFTPTALHTRLTALGFHDLQDLDRDAINARYFHDRSDGLRVESRLGRLIAAER